MSELTLYKTQTIKLTFAAAVQEVSKVLGNVDVNLISKVDLSRNIALALGFKND